MDAAGQLAQLLQRLRDRVARGGELLGERRVVAVAAMQHAQLQAEGDESLLRAVMEVALEPSPFGVARGDDPLARGP